MRQLTIILNHFVSKMSENNQTYHQDFPDRGYSVYNHIRQQKKEVFTWKITQIITQLSNLLLINVLSIDWSVKQLIVSAPNQLILIKKMMIIVGCSPNLVCSHHAVCRQQIDGGALLAVAWGFFERVKHLLGWTTVTGGTRGGAALCKQPLMAKPLSGLCVCFPSP